MSRFCRSQSVFTSCIAAPILARIGVATRLTFRRAADDEISRTR